MLPLLRVTGVYRELRRRESRICILKVTKEFPLRLSLMPSFLRDG